MGAGSYRLLMYSGNKDMTVPSIGTERWLASLNMTTTDKDYCQWELMKNGLPMVGGYFTDYSSMQFSTVHGAGMFTMADHPISTFSLVSNWLLGNMDFFRKEDPPEPPTV